VNGDSWLREIAGLIGAAVGFLAERLDRFGRRQGELVGRAEADKIWERIESADRDRVEDRAAQAALVEQVRGLERRLEEMAPDVKASAQSSAATAAAVKELLKELRPR